MCRYSPLGVASVKNLTGAAAGYAGGVCLVGVNVHGKSVFLAYSCHNIAENKRATLGRDFNAYYLLVLDAVLLSVGRGHMYMPFGGDDTLGQLNFPGGTYQLACA